MNLRIKEICKSKGISITQLAQMMDIRQESLSRAINGNPNITTLEKVATALGVEFVELFAQKDDFVALVSRGGNVYRFDSVEALSNYVDKVKEEQ